jgi:uncharacterized membrane protein YfcA
MDMGSLLVAAALAIAAGGVIKGTFGLGLPLVAMPLLTSFTSVGAAISWLVVPMLATNLAQGFIGGWPAVVARLRRFGVTLTVLTLILAVSIQAIVLIPEKILFVIIGVAVIGMSLLARFQPRLRVTPQQERWLGPLAAVAGGILGGMTTFFGPPLMVYLAGLRLGKDEFVGAVSLIYFTGSLGLGLGVIGFGIADVAMLGQSFLACVPAFIGIKLGQLIRVRMNEHRFANWLFILYLAIGTSFLIKAIP